MPIEAVIFDMDGVLVDSEPYWLQSRTDFARDAGKAWTDADQRAAMGRNTIEWARVMRERLEVDMSPEAIIDDMLKRMVAHYEAKLPVRPGALEAVQLAASESRVALSSGSPTLLIRRVLELTGLDRVFEAVVYGDDIARGKPAPDIYLETLRKLGVRPENAVGIEDSGNGIRALKAAGMYAIAAPSPEFPLPPDVLAMADHVIYSLEEFSLDIVRHLGGR